MPGCSGRSRAAPYPSGTTVLVLRSSWFYGVGGTMRTTSLVECPGAVVVHRDQSVSCTDDTCPRDLPKALWFSLHSSFASCSTALGGDGCLYCEFDAPVRAQTRRWQPE